MARPYSKVTTFLLCCIVNFSSKYPQGIVYLSCVLMIITFLCTPSELLAIINEKVSSGCML